jgi:cell division transport system permease protein
MKLLEPWLGSGISLSELPVPRLIVIKIAADATPDLGQLRRVLADQVPGAVVDDHRGWIDRMRAMAGTAIAVGVCILILMFAAMVLSVAFATRGAMATNKAVIEVLHFVGATNGFIARHFQHHFLMLGLQGGAIGGGAAIVVFVAAAMISHWFVGSDQGSALFGSFSIGLAGYAAVLGQVVLIAIVTAWTSRHTVNSTLESID